MTRRKLLTQITAAFSDHSVMKGSFKRTKKKDFLFSGPPGDRCPFGPVHDLPAAQE
jgi:hypothetical protein